MKGLILAGGTASRLHPLTLVTNKHLLPVYDRPMIYYPIETLRGMGIREVMVILGGRSIGDIVELLADGGDFGWISRIATNVAHWASPTPSVWLATLLATTPSAWFSETTSCRVSH